MKCVLLAFVLLSVVQIIFGLGLETDVIQSAVSRAKRQVPDGAFDDVDTEATTPKCKHGKGGNGDDGSGFLEAQKKFGSQQQQRPQQQRGGQGGQQQRGGQGGQQQRMAGSRPGMTSQGSQQGQGRLQQRNGRQQQQAGMNNSMKGRRPPFRSSTTASTADSE